MHKVIRFIVYSTDEEEALDRAKDLLNNMINKKNYYDYGTFFDDNRSTMSGKGRWGDKPPVSLADSKEGKRLIDEGIKYTKEEKLENLKKIRNVLENFTDEEVIEEEVLNEKTKILLELGENEDLKKAVYELRFIHYQFSCLGYGDSNIFLYDNEGEAIRNNHDLKNVLTKWEENYRGLKENPYKDLNVYVVPCDVHF